MNVALMHMSAGSWDLVGKMVEEVTEQANIAYKSVFAFLTENTLYNNIIGQIPEEVKSGVAAAALSILGLVFIVNFIGKTINLQWVTWENILMLLMQLLIAKVCVQNSEYLMGALQKGFSSMVQEIKPDTVDDFIDTSGKTEIILTADLDGSNDLKDKVIEVPNSYFYFLGGDDAAKAYWSNNPSIRGGLKKVKATTFDFSPAVAQMSVFVVELIMTVIIGIVFVMMISRFMWLAVYTVAAPLSLATFAADETKDIGKSFIKSYIAVCIHAMVMFIILISFSAVAAAVPIGGFFGMIGIIKVLALGGMIMKSESVANKLVGAM